MANTVNLEFAGDATKLARASQQAGGAVDDFGSRTNRAAADVEAAGGSADDYSRRVGNVGEAVSGATDAFDSIGAAMQAVADISDYSRERASRLERAQIDVMQAMADGRQAAIDLEQSYVDVNQAQQDLTQAALDYDQAAIDVEQAMLDEAAAQKEYTAAVREHGKGSDEAKQAALDRQQAQQDLAQANADLEQAELDVTQADVDHTQAMEDGTQATIDAREAQANLNDAMHEADPPELQEWADKIALVTPLLSAAVGVLGLVTAAQWAWNLAQLASPTTWIIVGIGALIGVVALLVTKTEWGRKAWDAAWSGMKAAASAVGRWFQDTLWGKWIKGSWDSIKEKGQQVWNWMKDLPGKLKDAFKSVGSFIYSPFRKAFNDVARAWNATIGRLSWTVPGWVPGVGGNSISAPSLPTFHQGTGLGTVPGAPGQEVLAVLQAGERVQSRASAAGGGGVGVVPISAGALTDAIIAAIADRVEFRGGRAKQLGILVGP